jgi:aspartate racemase
MLNTAEDQETLVLPAIECVKRGELARAHELALRAAQHLRAAGARALFLACTEIPPALNHAPNDIAPICIDATRALARACVAWWYRTPYRSFSGAT